MSMPNRFLALLTGAPPGGGGKGRRSSSRATVQASDWSTSLSHWPPTYLTSTVDEVLAFDLSFICLHASNLPFFDHHVKDTRPVIDLNTCIG